MTRTAFRVATKQLEERLVVGVAARVEEVIGGASPGFGL